MASTENSGGSSNRVQAQARTFSAGVDMILNSGMEDEDINVPTLATNGDNISPCITIAALLSLSAKEPSLYTDLCGTQTLRSGILDIMPSGNQPSSNNFSTAPCFINDSSCTSYVVNGKCLVHNKVFLSKFITEYTSEYFRVIQVPLCEIVNTNLVRIFPLLSMHTDLQYQDLLEILNHPDPVEKKKMAFHLSSISQVLDGSDKTINKSEFIKETLNFKEFHRPHMINQLTLLNNTNIYMYFSKNFKPTSPLARSIFTTAEEHQGYLVNRIKLSQLDNILDMYNLLQFIPSKVTQSNGVQVAYIPNVVIHDGYICYGAGFGMAPLVDPCMISGTSNSYIVHNREFFDDAAKYQTIRIAPMVLDSESTQPDPTLIVLNTKRPANKNLYKNTDYRAPTIDGQLAITYPTCNLNL